MVLKHKSKDELIQIIMELKDNIRHLEEIRRALIEDSLERDSLIGVDSL